MIRFLEHPPTERWKALCAMDPTAGPRMLTALQAYGTGSGIADFWQMESALEGTPAAALMRMDGYMTIAGDWEQTEFAELAAFLQSVGGFRFVEGTPELCRRLKVWLGGGYEGSHTMLHPGNPAVREGAELDAHPDPEQVFDILRWGGGFQGGTPRWEDWYPHVSHLMRHELGFTVVRSEKHVPAATGGVYAVGGGYGVLSAIATLPDYRGRGYAGDVVHQLCAECVRRGLTPVLRCKDDGLGPFYSGLGFSYLGGWARLDLEG